MILIREKPKLIKNLHHQKIKFAFFPKRLKRTSKDEFGEVIWLEKYVINYKSVQPYPIAYPERWEWHFENSERLSVATLHKFEEDINADCDKKIARPVVCY